MGFRVSQIDRKEKELSLYEGQLHITYSPAKVTPAVEGRAMALAGEQRALAMTVEVLVSVLSRWDLLDDNDQVIPLTHEAMAEVPGMVLSEIMQAVMEDLRPNPKSAEASGAGSLAG